MPLIKLVLVALAFTAVELEVRGILKEELEALEMLQAMAVSVALEMLRAMVVSAVLELLASLLVLPVSVSMALKFTMMPIHPSQWMVVNPKLVI